MCGWWGVCVWIVDVWVVREVCVGGGGVGTCQLVGMCVYGLGMCE